MELQTHSNALLCKGFPTTLMGAAQTWFNNLVLKIIKTFIDLANAFIGCYIASLPTQGKNSHLKTVKQKKGETLREYMAKFNSKELQILDLDELQAMEAM